jgi:hypothetical protein
VCDIVRKALQMCATSLGRSYENVCDIVRKVLRMCVTSLGRPYEKYVKGDVSICDSLKKT